MPFMQFYIGDYLRDTFHLSTEGHGAYLLTLFAMWNADGWVSAEPDKMARYARMTPARWAKVSPDIMPLLKVENGMVTQNRLLKELEKASGKSLKRSEAGKLGVQAKALKSKKATKANAKAIADGLLKHLPEPEPEPESKKQEAPAKAVAIVARETKSLTVIQTLPSWVPLDAWSGYLDMRRKKRMISTDRAIGMLITKLDAMRLKGHDPTEILDTATLNNWKSLYEPKENTNGNRAKPTTAHDKLNAAFGLFFEQELGDQGDSGGEGEDRRLADGAVEPLLDARLLASPSQAKNR
jgi:uncharacterized protein YdaU (DUF1376 family)